MCSKRGNRHRFKNKKITFRRLSVLHLTSQESICAIRDKQTETTGLFLVEQRNDSNAMQPNYFDLNDDEEKCVISSFIV